jgi:hypothetical protein
MNTVPLLNPAGVAVPYRLLPNTTNPSDGLAPSLLVKAQRRYPPAAKLCSENRAVVLTANTVPCSDMPPCSVVPPGVAR